MRHSPVVSSNMIQYLLTASSLTIRSDFLFRRFMTCPLSQPLTHSIRLCNLYPLSERKHNCTAPTYMYAEVELQTKQTLSSFENKPRNSGRPVKFSPYPELLKTSTRRDHHRVMVWLARLPAFFSSNSRIRSPAKEDHAIFIRGWHA